MISLTTLGLDAAPFLGGDSAELTRGVIAGAFVVAAAFLAGFSILRRGSAALCALFMVVAAGLLEFSALGLFQSPPPAIIVLLQGVFAGAAIFFLSAAIHSARNNAILGGVMFAAALSLIGLGVLNIVLPADLSGAMRIGLAGVGALAVILSAYEAIRGDTGAQLILPGVLIAVAGPIAVVVMGGEATPLLAHGLFSFGVLTASLVSLAEELTPRVTGWPLEASVVDREFRGDNHSEPSREDLLRVSENQLAQVLDYSGVSVWDWTRKEAHQTGSFGKIMGAAGDEIFTPDALRSFVHKNDLGKFDGGILNSTEGDGGFDLMVRLHNGEQVRMRGARAVDGAGELERLVVFLEPARPNKKTGPKLNKIEKTVGAAASSGAALKATSNAAASLARKTVDRRSGAQSDRRGATASTPELVAQVTTALQKKKLEAAFQPIVNLSSEEIVGYEALVRWPEGAEEAPNAGPEDIVRAAQIAGLGRDLARMMLSAAAAFLAKQLKSKRRDPLFVALNVSVAQIMERGFVDDVRKEISTNKLPAGALVLELTEAEQITDAAKSAVVFEKLKKAGASLAFDDFGAGFSSLSNLQKFSFDYLKIDKSFIGELGEESAKDDGGAAKIVASVASLGNDLGMKVIAEGIESREAAQRAKSMGCHFGQGFLFGEATLDGLAGTAGKLEKNADKKNDASSDESISRFRSGDADEKPERKRGWKSIWSNNGLR